MHHSYLAAIKSFEGYTPKAQWDYAQFSSGYGTKALHAGEVITPEEAEKRFAAEIATARSIVEKHAPAGLDEGTKAALTSLTFNAGTRWISSGLGDAVRRQDIEAVKERFLQYTKADGEVLPGLVRRRLAELDWIGRTPDGTSATANSPGTPQPAASSPAAIVASPSTGTPAETTTASASPANNFANPAAGDVEDPRDSQALSMLITLLFDLQMRSALADPLKQTETRADRQERST